MQFVCVIQLAALCGVLAGSSSTTTVDSSCTVNYDLTSSMAEMLVRYLDDTYNSLQAELAIVNNQINNSIIQIPTPGTWSNQWASEVYNGSTGVVNWGLLHQVDFLQFADSAGFNLLYGVSIVTTGGGLEPYTGVAPQLSDSALASCTTYNCVSQMYYYTLNKYGKPSPLNPYKTTSYNTPTRPWFWPNIVNPSAVTYNLYYTSNAQTNLFAMSMPYQQIVHSETFTEYKVAASMMVVQYLSDALAELNKGGANTVGYIMTTVYPVGLLLATTTTLKTNMTTFAVKSPNAVIASTAQYIIDNNIKTDTAGYVDSLGCYLDVQFVSYGNPVPTLITPPVSAGLPAASTVDVYPTTGIQWTVVSCNVQPAPTTTYSTTTDDDMQGSTTAQGLTAMVAIIFIIAVILGFVAVYYLCFAPKTGVSSGSVLPPPSSQQPQAVEMTTNSPMTQAADSKA